MTAHFPPGFTKEVAQAISAWEAQPANRSAKGIIQNFLDQYGLSSLGSWAWSQYLALGGGQDAITQIQFDLPQQKAFQQRFPAYAKLAKEGRVMSPADMISLEKSYAAALHGAGLPEGFYDSPNDFATYMLNNVSPSELAQRAQLAANVAIAQASDPQVAAQLAHLGVPAGHQAAYILDPTRALPLIQTQVQAAQDAAAGVETGFGQITKSQAMQLSQLGVTADNARQQFTQLASERGLMAGTTAEGTDISTADQLAAAFQGNAFAQKRIQQRQDQRIAEFKGSGGFNASQGGVAGLGEQT